MRKIFIVVLGALCATSASSARAAFVSCEDARNYGENSARLFVGQSFRRIACNADLLERVHLGLDRVLARQVLRTSDSDAEKVCFFEGMFDGLSSQLAAEYTACLKDPGFDCLPGGLLASHAGSLISALTLSLSDPSCLDPGGILALFETGAQAARGSLCSPTDTQECAGAILRTMSPLARDTFPSCSDPLAVLVCGP